MEPVDGVAAVNADHLPGDEIGSCHDPQELFDCLGRRAVINTRGAEAQPESRAETFQDAPGIARLATVAATSDTCPTRLIGVRPITSALKVSFLRTCAPRTIFRDI